MKNARDNNGISVVIDKTKLIVT